MDYLARQTRSLAYIHQNLASLLERRMLDNQVGVFLEVAVRLKDLLKHLPFVDWPR
jgi:hypothetical protein